MRNLAENPITTDEILDVLNRLMKEELDKETIGSINAACIAEAIKRLKALPK